VSDEPFRAIDVPLQPAATVMLLRDGDDGVEVFMLRRTLSAAFAGGQYVFPGGKVDGEDHAAELEPVCDGLDDASASARLGLDHGGLAWMVAAVRECFEEAGVLLARHHDAQHTVRFGADLDPGDMASAREEIHGGQRTLAGLCAEHGLRLMVDRIGFTSHWITPVGERRRFDTRFLVAVAPPEQEPLHDGGETIESLWVLPEDALRRASAGELQMFPPTTANLRWLSRFGSADEAVAEAISSPSPSPILPRVRLDDSGRVTGVALPRDSDYESVPLPEFVIGKR